MSSILSANLPLQPEAGDIYQSRLDATRAAAYAAWLGCMNEHFRWMLVAGYTADTVRGRRTAIKQFIRWVVMAGVNGPEDVTRPLLEDYQRALLDHRKQNGEPLAIASQIGCLAPLKTWFRWMARENRIPTDPCAAVCIPKLPRRIPRALLSVAEVEAILTQASARTIRGLRDRAMLETLYSTGLRRMELAHLRLADIDLEQALVFVREGKGRRDRVVPLGDRARHWVWRYLNEARVRLISRPSNSVFLNDIGWPVTREYVALIAKRAMTCAGVTKHGSAHLFRHACATHMLDNGADIRFIQALLGHARLETTELYTHVSIRKLAEVHAATHPANAQGTLPSPSDLQGDLFSKHGQKW